MNSSLGVGHNNNVYIPTPLSGISHAVSISTSEANTCTVKPDHTIWCSGSYANEFLGSTTTSNQNTPVQISGINDAKEVQVGAGSVCYINNSNNILCWGGTKYVNGSFVSFEKLK